ncbi:hypothetical protein D3C85_476640 [compost metagenome]
MKYDAARGVQHVTGDVAVCVHRGHLAVRAVIDAGDADVAWIGWHGGRVAAQRNASGVTRLREQISCCIVDVMRHGAQAVHRVSQPPRAVVDVHTALVALRVSQWSKGLLYSRRVKWRIQRNSRGVPDTFGDVSVSVVALAHHAARAIDLEDGSIQCIVDGPLALIIKGVGLGRGRHLGRTDAGRRQTIGVGGTLDNIAVSVVPIGDDVSGSAHGHRNAAVGVVVTVFGDIGRIGLDQPAQLDFAWKRNGRLQVDRRSIGNRADDLIGGVVAGLDDMTGGVHGHHHTATRVHRVKRLGSARVGPGNQIVVQVIVVEGLERQAIRIQRLGIPAPQTVVGVAGHHAVRRRHCQLLAGLVVGVPGHQIQAACVDNGRQDAPGLVERDHVLMTGRIDGLVLPAKSVVAVLRQQTDTVRVHDAAQALP